MIAFTMLENDNVHMQEAAQPSQLCADTACGKNQYHSCSGCAMLGTSPAQLHTAI